MQTLWWLPRASLLLRAYRLLPVTIGRNTATGLSSRTGPALKPIPPADRDMLGRWKPDGSDIYMWAYQPGLSAG